MAIIKIYIIMIVFIKKLNILFYFNIKKLNKIFIKLINYLIFINLKDFFLYML